MGAGGGISKLVIKAYTDNKFSSSKGEYTASINPEDITITNQIQYHNTHRTGPLGALRYAASSPRVLAFKLLFDNTGIIPGSSEPVDIQLNKLKDLICQVQKDTRAPHYVRVTWGVIDFKGRLTTLRTSYTRFRAEGLPIRAEAHISILEEIESSSAIKGKAGTSKEPTPPKNYTIGPAPSDRTTSRKSPPGGVQGHSSGATGSQHDQHTVRPEPTARGGQKAAPSDVSHPADTNRATADHAQPLEHSQSISDQDHEHAAAHPHTAAHLPTKNQQAAGTSAAPQTAASGTLSKQSGAASKPAATSAPLSISEQVAHPPMQIHQVKAGESLISIAKDKLKDPSLAPGLAALNGLNSLRGLAVGLKLAVPLSVGGLLAALIKKGVAYAKHGAQVLKKKAASAKDAVEKKAGQVKTSAANAAASTKQKAAHTKDHLNESAQKLHGNSEAQRDRHFTMREKKPHTTSLEQESPPKEKPLK